MSKLQRRKTTELEDQDDYNSAEYLSWRRLHLSKAKLKSVTEISAHMAGFAVVRFL